MLKPVMFRLCPWAARRTLRDQVSALAPPSGGAGEEVRGLKNDTHLEGSIALPGGEEVEAGVGGMKETDSSRGSARLPKGKSRVLHQYVPRYCTHGR